MDSTCVACPQCGANVDNKNRIITDSCGHKKCRQCFLSDEALCMQCKPAFQTKTINHIIETKTPDEEESPSIPCPGIGTNVNVLDAHENLTVIEKLNMIKTRSNTKKCKEIQKQENDKKTIGHIRTTRNSVGFLNEEVDDETEQSTQKSKRRIRKNGNLFGSHILEQETQTGNLEYHCTVCKKNFISRTQIYYHRSCGNSNGKKYKCVHCEKKFSSRSHLNYHSESHEDNTYNCSECNKSFSNEVIFKKHQKVHQKVSIKCPECGRSFRYRYSMIAHLAKHKNILRFPCEICDKKYSRKSTLQQHMLKHKEKKYQCSYCSKKFQRNSTLKLHMRRHIDSEDYRCTICPKVFRDSGALIRHSKIHTGSITFKCIECNITSVRKDNIMRHIRHIHNEKNVELGLEVLYESEQTYSILQEEEEEEVREEQSIKALDDRSKIESNPKTIRNSSVIKCVGNVEPVIIPSYSNENQTLGDNCTVGNHDIESNISMNDIHQNKSSNIDITPLVQKKLKKKYDPIEMYLKILNSEEDPKSMEQPMVVTKPTIEHTIQRSAQNHSNFSEMHWRKNFKYTYQHQDY